MYNKFIGSEKTYNEETNTYTYLSWIFPICLSFSFGENWVYSEISIKIFIFEFSVSLSEW